MSRKPVNVGGAASPGLRRPRSGSQSSCMAKNSCSLMANQKAAMAMPPTETMRSTVSGQRL